jgi:hypothetical protein
MGARRLGRSGRRYRQSRRLTRERRGVAAVVGTLLAMLVFFALFGVFLTQYLPLWMTDNESQFSSQVEGAFAQLKSDIDTQYVLGAPPTYGEPFPLSSQSVPLLSQPTEGVLSLGPPSCAAGFNPNGTPVAPAACAFERISLNVSSSTPTTQNHPYINAEASSVLSMSLPNRYYTPETYYLEDDALVEVQPGGHQILAIPPPLNATDAAGNLSISASFLVMYGSPQTVVGQGSENVYSGLLFSQPVSSAGRFLFQAKSTVPPTSLPFTFTYQIGTRNVCAWYSYLANFTAISDIPASVAKLTVNYASSFTPTPAVCYDGSGETYVVTLTFSNVHYATFYYAATLMSVGAGST